MRKFGLGTTAAYGLAVRSGHASAEPGNGGGFTFGRRVGAELVARAENDGADSSVTAVAPVVPEFWVPTPAGLLPPLLPGYATVSRPYRGIHFPIDNEVGVALGVSVTKVALAAWSS